MRQFERIDKVSRLYFLASKRKYLIICGNSFALPDGLNIASAFFQIRFREMNGNDSTSLPFFVHCHQTVKLFLSNCSGLTVCGLMR